MRTYFESMGQLRLRRDEAEAERDLWWSIATALAEGHRAYEDGRSSGIYDALAEFDRASHDITIDKYAVERCVAQAVRRQARSAARTLPGRPGPL